MRRSHYGPLQWSLAAPAPGTAAKFRRWNLVLIAILVFLVLGVFVVAEAPTTGSGPSNSANAQWRGSENLASLQHTKSIKGIQPDIQNRGGSAYLNKDLKSSHHAS
jgi:hypothetical protein